MPDLIANQTLRNNQFLQAKSSGGVDLNLMGMGSGNDLTIGASSNVNYNSILLNPGVATNPFQILRSTGQLQCGGPTRRVIISETGLTVGRTFTFPDVNAKLVGEGAAITEGANIGTRNDDWLKDRNCNKPKTGLLQCHSNSPGRVDNRYLNCGHRHRNISCS